MADLTIAYTLETDEDEQARADTETGVLVSITAPRSMIDEELEELKNHLEEQFGRG